MEYCNSCRGKFEIIFKTNVNYLKNDISTGETIWTWFRRIPKDIWVERYQKFVNNLNEVYKKKFNQKIKLLFDKYFICSNCGKEIQDKYWNNKESIRMTSFRKR